MSRWVCLSACLEGGWRGDVGQPDFIDFTFFKFVFSPSLIQQQSIDEVTDDGEDDKDNSDRVDIVCM